MKVVLLTHFGYGGAAVLRELVRSGRAPAAVVAETRSRPRRRRGAAGKGPAAVLADKFRELGSVHGAAFLVGRMLDRILRVIGLGSRYPFGLRTLRRLERVWLRIFHGILLGYPPGRYNPADRRIWFLEELCESTGVPLHTVVSLNGKKAHAILEALDADVFILAGTRILKPRVLALARRAVLNKHSSLLPWYRGLKAEFWTLRNRDLDRLGLTVHLVEPEVDSGPVVLQERLPFYRYDSHVSVRIRSQDRGAKLLVEALSRIESDPDFRGTPQGEVDQATTTRPARDDLRGYRRTLRELWSEAPTGRIEPPRRVRTNPEEERSEPDP